MESCDVTKATHVKVSDRVEKIVSKWGINDEGRLSKPSLGGFGVVTASGRKVSMWEAQAYFYEAEVEELVYPLVLTRSQQMALATFLSDYMRRPEAIEVSIDVLTDRETTPGDLLALVVGIEPRKRGDTL